VGRERRSHVEAAPGWSREVALKVTAKRHHVLGDERPDEKALEQMRERGGSWFAYQNVDMGHLQLGHLRFMRCGPGCTFEVPPEKHPDTRELIGWRYVLIGEVNLLTGAIE
jgi:hypothetical protein